MEQTVAMRIPQSWLVGIPQEPLTLEQTFRMGLYQYKVDRGLNSTAMELGLLAISRSSSACRSEICP